MNVTGVVKSPISGAKSVTSYALLLYAAWREFRSLARELVKRAEVILIAAGHSYVTPLPPRKIRWQSLKSSPSRGN